MHKPLRIGLTGGIGSGKSAAADEFSRLGAEIIDTDQIARELVEPGQPALDDIVSLFGDSILDQQRRLDRDKLRQRVFSNPASRVKLESVLHPRIRQLAIDRAGRASSAYCVLVIPLLAETGNDYPLDRILVIDTPIELQRQRVALRDKLSDSDIDAILAAQASREDRLAIADDTISNDGSLTSLRDQVQQLHRRYLGAAGQTTQET
jgi:dephospho-CoA kinase